MLTGRASRSGFTLVEIVIALTILSTSVLGLAAAGGRLSMTVATAELRALALEAVESRVVRIRLDPRYGALDSLFTAVEDDVFGGAFPGYSRRTTVTRVLDEIPPTLDYTRVVVEVSGPLLSAGIARHLTVAAP